MSAAIRQALVQKLQQDGSVQGAATGGVWPGLPPLEREAFPFVTVTTQEPASPDRVFQEVAFERAVYLVKAIDRSTSAKAAADLAALCRAALDYQDLTIEGYTAIGQIVWLGAVEYDEEDEGTTYQHQGGLFEVYAKAS